MQKGSADFSEFEGFPKQFEKEWVIPQKSVSSLPEGITTRTKIL
jgi:hypothetical protein